MYLVNPKSPICQQEKQWKKEEIIQKKPFEESALFEIVMPILVHILY